MKQAATLLLPLLIAAPGLSLYAAPPSVQAPAAKAAAILPALTPEQIHAESLYQVMAAEMALDREQPEIALANYIAAAKETQDAAIAARATQIALSLGSLETAVEPAKIWAKADPKNLEAQITTAALYIRLNQLTEAVPYLQKAEQTNPEEAFQYYLILFKQLQKDENARVIDALKLLAQQETKTTSAQLALAEIYLYQGEEPQALAMSEAALKKTPGSIVGIQIYAESLLRARGKDAAKAFLDKAIKEHPDPLLSQYYTQFLLDQGYTEEAKKEIAQLIKNPKLPATDLIQFARVSLQAQWFDLAETILNRTKNMDDQKDLSHYFLARLAEMRNQNNTAIEWYKQVLTGPFHVLSQIRASLLLSDKKQYEAALKLLAHTQPTDETDKKQILLTQVEILNSAGELTPALEILSQNLEATPDDIELLYARSLIAEQMDKIEIAETDLKAILAREPDQIEALNALGFMLANKTKRYDEAHKYLTQALKLAPNNASVLDSLGWLYYKQGDYQKSLATLQKALQIMPDAEIAAHLGEVMWQMKDYEGAKKIWKTAMEQNPEHQSVLETIKRFLPHKNAIK